jgi:hypothetical protein
MGKCRKGRRVKTSLPPSADDRQPITIGDRRQQRFQAWIVGEMTCDLESLLIDAEAPACAAEFRREPRVEEMKQQRRRQADEFALFGLAQALDFLGDMFKVRLAACSRAQAWKFRS